MASRQREKLEYIERHVVLNFSNGGGSVDAINNKPRLNYLKKVRKEEKKLGLRGQWLNFFLVTTHHGILEIFSDMFSFV